MHDSAGFSQALALLSPWQKKRRASVIEALERIGWCTYFGVPDATRGDVRGNRTARISIDSRVQ